MRRCFGKVKKPVRTISQALDLAIRLSGTSQKNNRWGGWRYSPEARDADTTSGHRRDADGPARCAKCRHGSGDEVLEAALEYMRRSTSKDGSVAYSGGFGGMGESMNRSAIATLVAPLGKEGDAEFKATLEHINTRLDHQEGHL